jgi:hypothetical protein
MFPLTTSTTSTYTFSRYSVSRATNPDEAFFRYWEEVLLMLQVPEKQVATVLLVFPELDLFGNYELFEAYCEWYVLYCSTYCTYCT